MAEALGPNSRNDDAGVTLVELLVATILMAVIGLVTTTAFVDAHKLFRATDDETTGLADVRIASERLAQDVRDARSVLCNPSGTPAGVAAADPMCVRHLQLWIDYNSDFVQEPQETVTWQLINTTMPGHHDLTRTSGATTQVEARTIVSQVAFGYDVQPATRPPAPGAVHTSTVNTGVLYDARLSDGSNPRGVSFSARLRNVR